MPKRIRGVSDNAPISSGIDFCNGFGMNCLILATRRNHERRHITGPGIRNSVLKPEIELPNCQQRNGGHPKLYKVSLHCKGYRMTANGKKSFPTTRTEMASPISCLV